jgi:hypothetical protein
MNRTSNKLMWVGLAVALIAALPTTFNAADTPPTRRATARSAPQPLNGRIVAVDRARKTVTVDIKGQLYVFRLGSQLTVLVRDKQVSVDALAPGQEISLVARAGSDGRFEIVAMSIAPGSFAAEAAGRSVGAASDKGTASQSVPGNNLPAPFRVDPNPANISGNVISPNK